MLAGQLKTFLGRGGSWTVESWMTEHSGWVMDAPSYPFVKKDCLRCIKAEECNVLASELKEAIVTIVYSLYYVSKTISGTLQWQ